MNDSKTYQAVRIGDIADWRLICVIGSHGMSAYLKHTDPTQDIVTLIDERWNVAPEDLLPKIEAAVYDNPQVLDDFTADIAIIAPKSIWVPTELVRDDDELAAEQYKKVYEAEDGDVMVDEVGEATCLYTLVKGLSAFLKRTFPGANVRSHMGVLARRLSERSADMPRVYVDIREGECDFLAFDRRDLMMGSTQTWHSPHDIRYHLWNILNVYGLNPEEVQVSISGQRELKNELMRELRQDITYVMLTMIPSIGVKAGMPLAGALMLRV